MTEIKVLFSPRINGYWETIMILPWWSHRLQMLNPCKIYNDVDDDDDYHGGGDGATFF